MQGMHTPREYKFILVINVPQVFTIKQKENVNNLNTQEGDVDHKEIKEDNTLARKALLMMESRSTNTQDVIVDMVLTSKNLAEVSHQESCCPACDKQDLGDN